MRKYALRSAAGCIGAIVYTPRAIGFSEHVRRGRVYTTTGLDPGFISHTQTFDFTSAVGSPTDILPGTPAGVFIPNSSTKTLLFKNRQPAMPVLWVSYSVHVSAQNNVTQKDKSEARRTGLG